MLSHRRSFRSFSSRALLVTLGAAAAACGVSTEASPELTGAEDQALQRPPFGVPALEGTLSVLYGFADNAAARTIYILNDSTGAAHSLSMSDEVLRRVAGDQRIDGATVRVNGALDPHGGMQVRSGFIMHAAPPVSTGHRTFANVLCRFKDGAHPAQEDPQYFQDLFGSQYPGVADYFKTASYGALDMSGGTTTDSWYELPMSLAEYQALATGPDPSDPMAAIVNGCRNTVGSALELNDYAGVNIILSENASAESFGGRWKFDEVNVNYPITVLSPTAFRSQRATVMAVGAALGMRRSSLTEERKLDSQWDLMSAGGTCAIVDATLGCVAVQPIADTRNALGWLGADDQAAATFGSSTSVRLSPLGAPRRPGTKKLATFSSSNGAYFTAELRTKASVAYEQNLPFEGVLLHTVAGQTGEVAPGSYRATVIDASPGAVDPTGQDVVLVGAGAKYVDQASGFGVMVDGVDGDEYTLSLFQPGVLTVTTRRDANAVGTVFGPGIACGATCSAIYAPGQAVTLTAQPGLNTQLRSFSGCDAWVGNTCLINDTTKPHAISADFAYYPPGGDDPRACYRECVADLCAEMPRSQCLPACHKMCGI